MYVYIYIYISPGVFRLPPKPALRRPGLRPSRPCPINNNDNNNDKLIIVK